MVKKTRTPPNFTMEESIGEEFDFSPTRLCQKDQCKEEGLYPAPKFRDSAHYYWFCLDHVKDYNQKWDYYKGMNPQEIDSHQRADMTWHRPSWPLGEGSSRKFIHTNGRIHDPFSIFQSEREDHGKAPCPFHPDSDEAKALQLMDLEMPLEFELLRNRYKALVKKYHPDHNPEDPLGEERLKTINHAYSVLKKVINSENSY